MGGSRKLGGVMGGEREHPRSPRGEWPKALGRTWQEPVSRAVAPLKASVAHLLALSSAPG